MLKKTQRRNPEDNTSAIWRIEIATEVEWIDKEEKIYNEVYFRKKWFFGIPMYDRKFTAYHGLEKVENNKAIGFKKQIMDNRRESLRRGDCLTSSHIIKKYNRKQRNRGISFILRRNGVNLDYIFIESPKRR